MYMTLSNNKAIITIITNNFQIMVDSVLHRGTMSNCEEDVDEFLISLKNYTQELHIIHYKLIECCHSFMHKVP